MDKLISKFTKKKQGNLLSDPAGSNVLRSPKAASSSSSSNASRHPDYNYEPAPHSYVGGDGAIGGLEWENESESIGEGYNESGTGDGTDSQEANVQVPTLGQVDQLTEAEEQAVAEAQAAMSMPVTSAPIAVVDDTFDEFAVPLTRSRSTDTHPPPPQPSVLVQSSDSTATVAPVPVVANVNVVDQASASPTESLPQPTPQSTPGLSSITPTPSSIVTPTTPSLLSSPIPTLSGSAAASAAALVPGSRSTSAATAVTAATLGSSSKPNSRRNSDVGISSPSTPIMSPATATSTDSPSKNSTTALALNPSSSDGTHLPFHPAPSSHATAAISTSTATNPSATSQPNSAAATTNEPRRSVSASQAVLTPNPAAAAASTPLPKQLGFSYPAQPMSRPTISGGTHAHAFSIGRAAMSEVKALVGQERLTASSGSFAAREGAAQQSPGFLAYSTAIAEAKEKARREKEAQKKSSGGLFSSLSNLGKDKDKDKEKEKDKQAANNNNNRPITGAPTPANPKPFPQLGRQPSAHSLPIPAGGLNAASNPSALAGAAGGAHGPPLPPRTHIRHRYSMTKYGSRRGSVAGPSVEKESQQQQPLTLDQLIPLRPLTHLYSTAYLLMYFAFHLYLPAIVALILPLLMYFLVLRIVQPYFHEENAAAPETDITAAISALADAEMANGTRSRNISNAANASTPATPQISGGSGSLSAAMIPPLTTSDIPPTPLEAVDDHNWDFEAEIEQSRRRRDGVVGAPAVH